MAIVSGDNWHHSGNTPYVEGVEYFNYTDYDIVVTDQMGVEIELLRSNERPARLEDRGKVIARVTRLVDPRRVNIPSTDAILAADRMYLDSFKQSVERQRASIGEWVSEHDQIRSACQAEVRMDFHTVESVVKSNLLGITVRATSNFVRKSHGNTPEGFINDVMVPELERADAIADGGKEKGVRTVFSARLIDNHNRTGTLWTSAFGEVTRINPVKDEEQKEGLYLAGGIGLHIKHFIPIHELMEPKRLLSLNLHLTEIEARRHNLGDHTISVTTERDKARKETNDIKTENKKLSAKIEELEAKATIEKINKAHGDFKQTVLLESVRENNVHNTLGNVSRLLGLVVGNMKTFMTFVGFLKAM